MPGKEGDPRLRTLHPGTPRDHRRRLQGIVEALRRPAGRLRASTFIQIVAHIHPDCRRALFIHNVGSASAYWWLDGLWIVLAEAKDTGGRFSMMEELLRKDSGPGPHKHTWSDETFYMLDGEIIFLIGNEIKTARTGDFLMVPRNTRHAFRVTSETAHFLNGYTPASLEAALVEFATPATERIRPPKNASGVIKMTPELLSRYGMDMLPGPDPLRPDGAGPVA